MRKRVMALTASAIMAVVMVAGSAGPAFAQALQTGQLLNEQGLVVATIAADS